MTILYEDAALLAIVKPAGLSSESGLASHPSAEKWAQEYVSGPATGPFRRMPYVRAVHRLDRVASGVLLFAKSKFALTALMTQFEQHRTEKVYWAEVAGTPPADAGRLSHFFKRSDDGRTALIFDAETGGSKPAVLRYRVLEKTEGHARLEIIPETGRYHQIRAQLAHIGCPITGDVRYGGPPWRENAVKLHSGRLVVQHPQTGEPLVLEAPLPEDW